MVFDVIEAMCTEPVRIFAAPKATFKPGYVGQLFELDGNLVCDLSNGSKPFGIIADYKITPYDDFNPSDLIRVWPQRMVFRTDEFDKKAEYSVGDAMYVNESGILTTKSSKENVPIVARLILPPSPDKSYLEALWL